MESLYHVLAWMVVSYIIFMYSFGLLVRKKKIDKDYSYEPMVSVLMPGFNEGSVIYRTIESLRQQNYPVDKLEILAYDDCSVDDTFEWMQKAENDFENVIARKNPHNKGKSDTQMAASEVATGEILVGVDSDCEFDRNAIRELVAGFTSDNIAGVGGVVNVRNKTDSWLTYFQAALYAISFGLTKHTENYFKRIQCLSGPLVAFRKSCYFEIKDRLKNRNFLGTKVTYGEDSFLTQLLLIDGYGTILNDDSICHTDVPTGWIELIKQQLRWRKGAIYRWFYATINIRRMMKNAGFASLMFGIQPFLITLIIGFLFVISFPVAPYYETIFHVLTFHMFIFAPMFGFLYNHVLAKKEDRFNSTAYLIFNLMLAGIFFPFNILVITPWALLTIDDGGWTTRT